MPHADKRSHSDTISAFYSCIMPARNIKDVTVEGMRVSLWNIIFVFVSVKQSFFLLLLNVCFS